MELRLGHAVLVIDFIGDLKLYKIKQLKRVAN